jgi:hypothetical protein
MKNSGFNIFKFSVLSYCVGLTCTLRKLVVTILNPACDKANMLESLLTWENLSDQVVCTKGVLAHWTDVNRLFLAVALAATVSFCGLMVTWTTYTARTLHARVNNLSKETFEIFDEMFHELQATKVPIKVARANEPGLIGATGATGALGATGAMGVTGAVGITGPVGATGAVGATGSVGATGTAGVMGVAGVTGEKGSNGEIGKTGPPGASGIEGCKGSTGATGVAGSTGMIGPAGPSGMSVDTTSLLSTIAKLQERLCGAEALLKEAIWSAPSMRAYPNTSFGGTPTCISQGENLEIYREGRWLFRSVTITKQPCFLRVYMPHLDSTLNYPLNNAWSLPDCAEKFAEILQATSGQKVMSLVVPLPEDEREE